MVTDAKSRNDKTILQLIDIAKKCEEYVFQENPEYLKFKAKKKN